MFKKCLCIGICVVLLFTLAGCKKNQKKSEDTAPATTTTTTTVPTSAESTKPTANADGIIDYRTTTTTTNEGGSDSTTTFKTTTTTAPPQSELFAFTDGRTITFTIKGVYAGKVRIESQYVENQIRFYDDATGIYLGAVYLFEDEAKDNAEAIKMGDTTVYLCKSKIELDDTASLAELEKMQKEMKGWIENAKATPATTRNTTTTTRQTIIIAPPTLTPLDPI